MILKPTLQLCLLLPLLSGLAMAQTGGNGKPRTASAEVLGAGNGQIIYDVVYPNEDPREKDADGRAPGIYGVGVSKTEPVLISGNVLGVNRGFNGVLAQFSIGQLTGDHDAL